MSEPSKETDSETDAWALKNCYRQKMALLISANKTKKVVSNDPGYFFSFWRYLSFFWRVRETCVRTRLKAAKMPVRYVAFDSSRLVTEDIFVCVWRLAGLLESPLGQRWDTSGWAGQVELGSCKRGFGGQLPHNWSFASIEVKHIFISVTLWTEAKAIWQFSRMDTAGQSTLRPSLEQREKLTTREGQNRPLNWTQDEPLSSQVVSKKAGDYRFGSPTRVICQGEYSWQRPMAGSFYRFPA